MAWAGCMWGTEVAAVPQWKGQRYLVGSAGTRDCSPLASIRALQVVCLASSSGGALPGKPPLPSLTVLWWAAF